MKVKATELTKELIIAEGLTLLQTEKIAGASDGGFAT